MRIILVMLASITFLSANAQAHLPVGGWHLSKYAGLSAGSAFFPGGTSFFPGGTNFFPGGTSFLSAPLGLQLSYPLNKNLYAIAGISAAPVYFSFSRLYTAPVINPSYPGYNLSKPYGIGLNSRVEAGLMYINDAKTFSISGSFSIDRSSYPVYPTNGMNTKKQ